MVTIKTVAIEDLSTLLKWRDKVLREVFSLDTNADLQALIEQNRKYYLQAIPNDKHIACFAYQGNEIIGCGGLCVYDEMPSPDNKNGKCGYLMNIYVAPTYRNQGVGKQIVTYLVGQAKSVNIGKIYLETADGAKEFYAKLGFSDLQGFMKL